MPYKHKIAVIGAGAVGASIAYACVLTKVPANVVMVDVDKRMVEGQVLDLSDVGFLSPVPVSVGTVKEAGQCDIIVITAGAKQRPGEPRSELVERNRTILKSVIDGMQPIRKDAIMILVANPVDVLTYLAQQLSGLPRKQVFGSGTFLDSMRLRGYLADKLQVQQNALHCYVLGEHGDRQFVGWSTANIGCTPLLSHPLMKDVDLATIERQVMRKAYEIIDRKGATCFGIGGCVASLCNSVLNDRRDVRPVSCWDEKHQVCLSTPASVGIDGIEEVLEMPLNEREQKAMDVAVKAIKDACQRYSNEETA
ncbi:lactate dehydrogenase/glycoside hydrolase [Thamnocephalis sphaerospora]|uniref:L-lactate dehydrogenase n=1 Tax=Thamnocephalis sphaerospora TaxID=78915 RepID=A0A4P9XWY5_9FUNG|nr:lactate dehydrogenase/glycoside hydrolase [Thamnocephalis sphaerospora]|eukprot:RKP10797.1 lactate dehydrogenase/glycoside hydrolase [Thamnocephalis sphaerospora]